MAAFDDLSFLSITIFVPLPFNLFLYSIQKFNLFFLQFQNGGRRGSIGGYSGNINQSNHIPVAPPPPRKGDYF